MVRISFGVFTLLLLLFLLFCYLINSRVNIPKTSMSRLDGKLSCRGKMLLIEDFSARGIAATGLIYFNYFGEEGF